MTTRLSTADTEVKAVPAEAEVPSFLKRTRRGKCRGKPIDVRPNWKEQPRQPSLTGKQWR
jgi:hypothetical protein